MLNCSIILCKLLKVNWYVNRVPALLVEIGNGSEDRQAKYQEIVIVFVSAKV